MKNSFVLAGSLDFLNLSEIFQLLGANNSTGILEITSRYHETPGVIYFRNGNPVEATAVTQTGLDAVYALFGWTEGEFEFRKETVDRKAAITKNRMEIMLEGLKMLDDGLIEKVGPISFQKDTPSDTVDGAPIPTIKGPLVDYMYVADEEDYEAGETIAKQGRHGNWIWVVLAGKLEIRKETPTSQIPVLRLGPGSFFGSLAAFIVQGSVRHSTAVALTTAQLGVLDSQRLSRENALLSHPFRKILKSIDKRYRQCANFSADAQLKKKKSPDFLKGKEPLFQKGESKEGLFLIEQGNAFVVRKLENGYVMLARLEEGDFLGQASFINMGHEPHSASVFASEDLVLKQMPDDELDKEYAGLSTTMKNLIENICNAISAMTVSICDITDKL